jgi:hypothetical protein
MEWYEILIVIVIVRLGAYIRGKIYEFMRGYDKNGSWRSRGKG